MVLMILQVCDSQPGGAEFVAESSSVAHSFLPINLTLYAQSSLVQAYTKFSPSSKCYFFPQTHPAPNPLQFNRRDGPVSIVLGRVDAGRWSSLRITCQLSRGQLPQHVKCAPITYQWSISESSK